MPLSSSKTREATSTLQKSPLGAEVVVEAGAGGHGLSVEVRGEGAVLHAMNTSEFRICSYYHSQQGLVSSQQAARLENWMVSSLAPLPEKNTCYSYFALIQVNYLASHRQLAPYLLSPLSLPTSLKY